MNVSARPPAHFRLGIVTGLQEEADIVRDALEAAPFAIAGNPALALDSTAVSCHGPGASRAAAAAAELIAGGARALLSFGVAGGCDPALPAGTVVLATGIRDFSAEPGEAIRRGETLWTNREWRRRLQSALLGTVLVEEAAIASFAAPVIGAREKEALFWSDGVAALDMESGAVARAAIGASLPFMALRAILDPADAGIPPAALAGVDADGRTHVAAVIAAVFRRPQDIAPLLRVAGAHRNATGALARAAAAAAPLFGAV